MRVKIHTSYMSVLDLLHKFEKCWNFLLWLVRQTLIDKQLNPIGVEYTNGKFQNIAVVPHTQSV